VVLQSSNNQQRYEQFGEGSDTTVPGDYNDDGRADFTVWRQGGFYFSPTSGGGSPTGLSFGTAADFPDASVSTN